MNTININEATGPQLVWFAQNALNIEGIRPNMSKAEMIAKIRAVSYDKDTIEVEDLQPAKVKAADPSDTRDKVRIIIPASDAPGGQDPVPVSVNGSAMLIPRDQECEVPYPYYEALKNAVRQVYTPLPDGGLSPPKDVPAYPFSRVG
jgi:hypothetical protein